MKNLSRFTDNSDWVMASPASDSLSQEADILVCRNLVRRKNQFLRTYVLVNYCHETRIEGKHGAIQACRSAIYRTEFSEETKLSRISAIAYFPGLFACGRSALYFFYPDQPWEKEQEGLSGALIQFMQNHAPACVLGWKIDQS